MKKISITILFYGSGIIVLGFFAGYPIAGILLALFIVVSFYALSVASMIQGAEIALRNPPPPGETKITLKVFEKEIPMSNDFIFSPPTTDGQPHNFIINKGGGRPEGTLKDGDNINLPDVMTWHKEAKRILEEVGYQEFVKFCNAAGQNESTIRSRIKKYFT